MLVLGTASHRYEVMFERPRRPQLRGLRPGARARSTAWAAPSRKIADIKTPSFPQDHLHRGHRRAAAPRSTPSRPRRAWRWTSARTTRAALLETEKKVFEAIDDAVAEENKRWNVTHAERARTKLIGDRPGGRTPTDAVIVEAAVRANAAFGHSTLLRPAAAPTPTCRCRWASWPSSSAAAARPAASTRLSEWIDLHRGPGTARRIRLVTVLGLVGVQGVERAACLAKRTAAVPGTALAPRTLRTTSGVHHGIARLWYSVRCSAVQPQPPGWPRGLGSMGGMGDLGGVRAGRSAACSPTTASSAGSAAWSPSSNRRACGDVIGSWIGKGENAPVSGGQLQEALGSDHHLRPSRRSWASTRPRCCRCWPRCCPRLIDRLTPKGAGAQRKGSATTTSCCPRSAACCRKADARQRNRRGAARAPFF